MNVTTSHRTHKRLVQDFIFKSVLLKIMYKAFTSVCSLLVCVHWKRTGLFPKNRSTAKAQRRSKLSRPEHNNSNTEMMRQAREIATWGGHLCEPDGRALTLHHVHLLLDQFFLADLMWEIDCDKQVQVTTKLQYDEVEFRKQALRASDDRLSS